VRKLVGKARQLLGPAYDKIHLYPMWICPDGNTLRESGNGFSRTALPPVCRCAGLCRVGFVNFCYVRCASRSSYRLWLELEAEPVIEFQPPSPPYRLREILQVAAAGKGRLRTTALRCWQPAATALCTMGAGQKPNGNAWLIESLGNCAGWTLEVRLWVGLWHRSLPKPLAKGSGPRMPMPEPRCSPRCSESEDWFHRHCLGPLSQRSCWSGVSPLHS